MSEKFRASRKANSKTDYNRGERDTDKLKKEHLIVLQSLEIANRAYGRVVTVNEITRALSKKEYLELSERYKNELAVTISKILGLLSKRGKVIKSAMIGNRCFYGLVGLLILEDTDLDVLQSRRSRVLNLVKAAIVENNRALQMGEIIDFARKTSIYSDLGSALISGSVLSLKETGELIKFPLRGSEKGFGVYLLPNLNPDEYLPKEPITWLEFVLANFNELWSERESEARKNNVKPQPLAPGEIKLKLIAENKFSDKLQDNQLFFNALVQLAGTATPSLKKIRKPNQKSLFWIPSNVRDDEVDLTVHYLNDKERIKEAVKRASLRLERPVNINEIKEERIDPDLVPVSKSTYRSLLSDAARSVIYKRKKSSASEDGVYRFGKFQKNTYYYFKNEPNADSFIRFRLLEQKWNDLETIEEINRIKICSLPGVAFGRMKLLDAEIQNILKDVKKLLSLKSVVGFSKEYIQTFLDDISKKRLQIKNWLKNNENTSIGLPQDVQSIVKGWTGNELKQVITPVYYRMASGKSKSSLQAIKNRYLKRIANPNFKQINLKTPLLAAEYLYDEVYLLMYIGKKWGGIECRYHASVAFNEIGCLRDPRFVIPALDDKDFNVRLCAVSCLAFLPSEDGNDKLFQLAANDIDAGVRQSALWACGFIGEENAIEFIQSRILQDKDPRVKDFAKNIIENYKNGRFSF